MSILQEIFDGWKNMAFQSEEIEEIAIKRIKLCVSCDQFKSNKTCKKCGCYMPAKTRSMRSKCPLNKWDSEII